jgi:ribosome-binding factor A
MGLRQDKIADQIRDVIASCLTGGQMRDPRLESVTVTAVQVTADLQNAKVYFRVYEDRLRSDAENAMRSAGGFFRKKLAHELDVRRVPELAFYYDESIENAARIETLLGEISDKENS